tara:strand:+ start:91 stop:489 length:399 start_codon:yes stop_codon:yes gene_type:complete
VATKISRAFKDISFAFTKHPVTGDVSVITNESAINRAVRNLVLTSFGERPFDPSIGSDVADVLFENVSPFTAGLVASKIRETIASFEPRVRVTDVEVNPDVDNNAYEVTIIYDIRGLARSGQVLNFALESAS